MSAKIFKCRVTLKRADETTPISTQCVRDGASYLAIPVEDFGLPLNGDRSPRMLWIPDAWLFEVEGAPDELECRKIIDLDQFDQLPWANLEAPPRD